MIVRYFSDTNFKRLLTDFQFLVRIIKSYKGELEMSFRNNYFNLYFRGNNATRVSFKKNGEYKV